MSLAPLPDGVARARQVLRDAVQRRVFPAAVAEFGTSTGALWQEAFGRLTFDTESPSTSLATIFDLASLTKPLVTTSVILQLVSQQRMRLEDSPSRYCPDWAGLDREVVTIRHLLEHASGLSARFATSAPDTTDAFEHEICTIPLEYRPGSAALYSDLGFILLGICAERAGGASLSAQTTDILGAVLDQSALARSAGDVDPHGRHVGHEEHIEQDVDDGSDVHFERNVRLAPHARDGSDARHLLTAVPADLIHQTAPTTALPEDRRQNRRLQGEVHDNYAAALGGFAGHAGLFGSAPGVSAIARAILTAARGVDAPSPFTSAGVAQMTTRSSVPDSTRALGWDTMRPTSSCGRFMSPAAFGHVGFTGTSLWIDPTADRFFVLLTNRVCDGGSSDDMQVVRKAFHEALTTD